MNARHECARFGWYPLFCDFVRHRIDVENEIKRDSYRQRRWFRFYIDTKKKPSLASSFYSYNLDLIAAASDALNDIARKYSDSEWIASQREGPSRLKQARVISEKFYDAADIIDSIIFDQCFDEL